MSVICDFCHDLLSASFGVFPVMEYPVSDLFPVLASGLKSLNPFNMTRLVTRVCEALLKSVKVADVQAF